MVRSWESAILFIAFGLPREVVPETKEKTYDDSKDASFGRYFFGHNSLAAEPLARADVFQRQPGFRRGVDGQFGTGHGESRDVRIRLQHAGNSGRAKFGRVDDWIATGS